jgi:glutathione S-transferase
MSDVKLFGSNLSPFVEKTARGLALKKLGFELVPPRSPSDLRRWNPQTGKMPVLEIDGKRIYDSTLILRWLDERVPDPPLVSRDPATAAGQRQLEDWSDESLYWLLMGLRWLPRNADASARQITDELPAPGFVKPFVRALLRRQLAGSTRAQGFGRLPAEVLERELGIRLDDLVALLGDRPFFFADAPSVADLSVFGMVHSGSSGPTPEFERAFSERPELREWQKRVEQATGS